jgi:peroxiredoxin
MGHPPISLVAPAAAFYHSSPADRCGAGCVTKECIMAHRESGDSLAALFGQLQAERARTWPEAQLAANSAQRLALLAGFDSEAAVKVGDRLAPFALSDPQGGTLTLDQLIARGPTVLIFFRYATCPADNLALPYYDRELAGLIDAGVPVVAISPQIPERLDAIRARHGLRIAVASDRDNELARRLGLTFTPLETPAPPPSGWIGEVTGTDSWELPLTSALIVDADRVVRFVSISPDWLDRVEAPQILAALSSVAGGSARALASAEP